MGKLVRGGLTVPDVPYGDSVKAGDLVGWSAGKLVRASGNAGAPIEAAGIAAASYRSGDVGSMHLMGEVGGFAGLTPGETEYLSLTTPGGIQSTYPSGVGSVLQVVGFAVAADRVAVVIGAASYL